MSNNNGASWSLAFSFAKRELRGGLKGFRIFFACLVLGVSAIAGIGSLTQSLQKGLDAQGQALLAGDLEVRVFRRTISEGEEKYLSELGELSKNLSLTGLVRAPKTDRRILAQVKAVEKSYPLYGNLVVEPTGDAKTTLDEKNGFWGAFIPSNLATRLEVSLGDELIIGDAHFEVRGILITEPDRANASFQWGPTIMTSWDAIAPMNLIKEGSLYQYIYKIKFADNAQSDEHLSEVKSNIERDFPDNAWRMTDRNNSAPGMRTMIERMGMFLTLVALSALVVGGVGVGGAIRNYVDGKAKTIATFKILGATGTLIFRIYLIQVMTLALAAIAVGLVFGSIFPLVAAQFLPSEIPVAIGRGLYFIPLLMATAYGILITLSFAIWPLAKSQDITAAKLLRAHVAPNDGWPKFKYALVVGLSAIAIIALAVGFSKPWTLSAGFVVGALATLLLLRGLGLLIERVAKKLPHPKRPLWRLALANLHRPSAATGAVVMAMGLGLTLFATISLVEGNMARQVEEQLPGDVPAFFMVDIQKDQKEPFEQLAHNLVGVGEVRMVPNLRGRLTHIDGVAAEDVDIRPDVKWVVNGDRSLTYSSTIPKGNSITEGIWWDENYQGTPLVSFAAREAEGLGIKVGSKLTMNILGRDIEATVANLRGFNWGTVSFNFVMVFSPNVLENAPHHYMASLKIDPSEEAAAHKALTDTFPNITAVRMKDVLETIDAILSQIGMAVKAMATIAILAGILVLAGALAAGHKHRVYDAVILKVLGAVRMDVIKAYLLEYLALGLITGVIAIGIGSLAGFVVVKYVMNMEFYFLPFSLLTIVMASLVLTIVLGLVGTWRALAAKPFQVLRDQ